jgi:hypothetical protein
MVRQIQMSSADEDADSLIVVLWHHLPATRPSFGPYVSHFNDLPHEFLEPDYYSGELPLDEYFIADND